MSRSPSLPSLKANRNTLSCSKLAGISLVTIGSHNLFGPFTHETKRPAGTFSNQDFAGFDHDERLVPLLLHVKMCRAMVSVVHADVDSEKEGDDRHGGLRRLQRVRDNLYEGRFDLNQIVAERRIRRTKFEMVIKLKTAKVLGITAQQLLLLRADEAIQ